VGRGGGRHPWWERAGHHRLAVGPAGAGIGVTRKNNNPKQHAGDLPQREVATLPVPVAVAGQIVEGRAPDVLADVSRDADLLVLGSHRHGRARHALLGSVSEEVVRKATCPVVVVPEPPVGPGQGRKPFKVATFRARGLATGRR
jgi:nucleotide-binding universal stress UspA family protein